MKKFTYLAALLVLGAAVLFGCAKSEDESVTNPNPNPIAPTGHIQGRLIDSVTQQPIAGAVVDIGVGRATTSQTGQFVIRNVPVNGAGNLPDLDGYDGYDYCGDECGEYKVTIDMRSVSSPVAMSTQPAVSPRYADFYYDYVRVTFDSLNDTEGSNPGGGSGSNHDTPVTGLVANMDVRVGKLAATIKGVVVNSATNLPVGEGYTVKLVATYSDNSSTGGDERVVLPPVTTDANGAFTFEKVETRRYFEIRAYNSTMTSASQSHTVTTPGDGETLTLIAQGSGTGNAGGLIGPAVKVYPVDSVLPLIVSTVPANNADLGPPFANVEVKFVFNEAILASTYALALDPSTAAVDGLWRDVMVSFLGPKTDGDGSGNVAHTLAWNAAMTELTVTIAQAAPSSRYEVALKKYSVDHDNNPDTPDAEYATKLTDGARNRVAWSSTAKVAFTTSGGQTPAQVTGLQLTSPDTVDYNGLAGLDWALASGAKTYNLYCAYKQLWSTEVVQEHQYVLWADEIPASDFNFFQVDGEGVVNTFPTPSGTLVENNQIPLQVLCYVKGVSSDHLEGAASDTVTIVDKVGPKVDQSRSVNNPFDPPALPAKVGETKIGVVVIPFSEPMNEALAETLANYSIAKNTGARSTEVLPTIDRVNYDPETRATFVRLSLTRAAATDTYEGEWTITAANLTDVAGNAIQPAFSTFNNGTKALPTLAVAFTNEAKIDAFGPAAQFDWNPYPQAKQYRWSCELFELWPGVAPQFDESTGTTTSNATEASAGPFALVEFQPPYAIQKIAECQVEALDVEGDPIARSPILTVKDVVKPKLVQPVQGFANLALPAAGQKQAVDLTLVMTEPLDEVTAETVANYTIAKNAGAPASDLVPVVKSATYNASDTSFGALRRTVTLNVELDNTAGTGTYTGEWTLTVGAGVTDIAGNAFDTSKAINNTFSPVTAGTITLTLLDTQAFGPAANPAGNPDFDWLPVAGAANYQVIRNREVGGSLVLDQTVVCNTAVQTFCAAGLAPFVDSGKPVTMVYQLFARDAGNNVIAQSNLVKISDTVRPRLAAWDTLGGLFLPSPGAGNFDKPASREFQVRVFFDELMQPGALEAPANYTLAVSTGAPAPAATDVLPVITRVDILNNQTAQLTLTVTNPPEAAAAGPETTTLYTDLTLNVLNQKDVAGNAINGAADQIYNGPTVPTGVTTNPF